MSITLVLSRHISLKYKQIFEERTKRGELDLELDFQIVEINFTDTANCSSTWKLTKCN
jgi:hypothetical protein